MDSNGASFLVYFLQRDGNSTMVTFS